MNGRGLLSKTILLAILFTISIFAQIAVSTAGNQNDETWKFLANIDFIVN
jgi:hypothetical protein